MKYIVAGQEKSVVPCTWEVKAKNKDEALAKVQKLIENKGEPTERQDWNGYVEFRVDGVEGWKHE